MARIFTIILVAASLAACSPEVWRKSGASEQDVTVDMAACRMAARQSSDGSTVVYRQVVAYNYFNNCMADRGYLVSLY